MCRHMLLMCEWVHERAFVPNIVDGMSAALDALIIAMRSLLLVLPRSIVDFLATGRVLDISVVHLPALRRCNSPTLSLDALLSRAVVWCSGTTGPPVATGLSIAYSLGWLAGESFAAADVCESRPSPVPTPSANARRGGRTITTTEHRPRLPEVSNGYRNSSSGESVVNRACSLSVAVRCQSSHAATAVAKLVAVCCSLAAVANRETHPRQPQPLRPSRRPKRGTARASTGHLVSKHTYRGLANLYGGEPQSAKPLSSNSR